MKPVKLQDIVDEMEIQPEGDHILLETATGQIFYVTADDMEIAEEIEEDDDLSRYPESERDSIRTALDVFIHWGDRKYIPLPTQFDIHEYSIMERFCLSVDDEALSDILISAIRGRGAFRRFKDAISRYDIEEQWYAYRDKALLAIARQWCEANQIPYQET